VRNEVRHRQAGQQTTDDVPANQPATPASATPAEGEKEQVLEQQKAEQERQEEQQLEQDNQRQEQQEQQQEQPPPLPAANEKNPYTVLQVSTDISQGDLRKVYRALAKKWYGGRF
jgi:hypothetical protein